MLIFGQLTILIGNDSSILSPFIPWILRIGFWNDLGDWKDTSLWID